MAGIAGAAGAVAERSPRRGSIDVRRHMRKRSTLQAFVPDRGASALVFHALGAAAAGPHRRRHRARRRRSATATRRATCRSRCGRRSACWSRTGTRTAACSPIRLERRRAADDRRGADRALPDAVAMTAPGDLNRRLLLEAPVEDDDGAGGVTRALRRGDDAVGAGRAAVGARRRRRRQRRRRRALSASSFARRATSRRATAFQDGARIYRVVAARLSADRRFLEIDAEELQTSDSLAPPPDIANTIRIHAHRFVAALRAAVHDALIADGALDRRCSAARKSMTSRRAPRRFPMSRSARRASPIFPPAASRARSISSRCTPGRARAATARRMSSPARCCRRSTTRR